MFDTHALVDGWSSSGRIGHVRPFHEASPDRSVPSGLYVDERSGSGAPIVMLHGVCGSAHSWRKIVEVLHAGPSFAVDLLGFGRSPWPECAYAPARHVDAIEDARDSTGAAPLRLRARRRGRTSQHEGACRGTK